MKSKHKLIIQTDYNQKNTRIFQSKEFLEHIQISLLLALLENNLITRYQFEQCTEEIQKS
ncbi:MAG: hypothetical protein WCD89_26115 [Anaerocolumna sp.]